MSAILPGLQAFSSAFNRIAMKKLLYILAGLGLAACTSDIEELPVGPQPGREVALTGISGTASRTQFVPGDGDRNSISMEHRRPESGQAAYRAPKGRQCRRLRIHEPPGGCTLPDLLQHDRHRRRSRRSDRTTPGGAGQTATRTERRFRLCHDRLRRTIHPLARHRLRLVQPLVAGREGEARFRHAGSDRRLDRTDRYAHLRRHRIQRCDRCEQRRNAFVRQGGCRTARDEQHRERIRRSGRLSGGLQRRGNTRNLHLRRRQRLYRDQNRTQFRSGPYLPPDDRDYQSRRRQPGNSGAGGFGRRTNPFV